MPNVRQNFFKNKKENFMGKKSIYIVQASFSTVMDTFMIVKAEVSSETDICSRVTFEEINFQDEDLLEMPYKYRCDH